MNMQRYLNVNHLSVSGFLQSVTYYLDIPISYVGALVMVPGSLHTVCHSTILASTTHTIHPFRKCSVQPFHVCQGSRDLASGSENLTYSADLNSTNGSSCPTTRMISLRLLGDERLISTSTVSRSSSKEISTARDWIFLLSGNEPAVCANIPGLVARWRVS
jgi:hypothetical protein